MSIPHSERKEYRAKYIRQHYSENKQYYKDNAAKRRNKVREYITAQKNKPCSDCGKSYPPYVMDFDHTGEDKTLVLSLAARQGWSIARIDAEIAKCDLVCSNCHRKRTHERLSLISSADLEQDGSNVKVVSSNLT